MARRPQKPDEPSLLDQLSAPLRDFVKDFKVHGKDVLEKVRERSPEKYLELSAKLASLVATLRPEPDGLAKARTKEEMAIQLLKSVGVEDEAAMTEDMIAAILQANDAFVTRVEEIAQAAGVYQDEDFN